MKRIILPAIIIILLIASGCATESSRAVQQTPTHAALRPYTGERSTIVVGGFENQSDFMRGVFYEGDDRLGGQAKTLLIAHLTQTNRFMVLDRDNMDAAIREAQLRGQARQTIGARYILTGAVTEFARKETGDFQLYGILGSGRQQIAYSSVTLNVVDIVTSAIVYSVQGAGEYALSNREIAGFGSTARYDATLNGKVLDLAVREAVDRLAEAIDLGFIRMN